VSRRLGLPPALAADIALAWVAARAVVLVALALTHGVASAVGEDHPGVHVRTVGLFGWDAGWYREIAEHGYRGDEPLRFFPLVPMLARILGLGVSPGAALLVIVNLAALAYAVLLARLAMREGLDLATTRRTIWLLALAPPAFVLVMGYTEAVWGVLAVGVLLAVRSGRWASAASLGVLAGLCRPVGMLLAVPAAIEACRGLSAASAAERVRRALAVLGPLAGTAIYLGWAGATHGDAFSPLRQQRRADLHGSSGNPVEVVVDAAKGTFHGQLGTGLHVPWLLLVVGLVVLMAWRLPASYTAWSALTLATVLTGTNLDSLERYAYGTFPIVMVAAMLARGRRTWWLVLVGSTSLLILYATLAFFRHYVP
jgi:hypothetical protein